MKLSRIQAMLVRMSDDQQPPSLMESNKTKWLSATLVGIGTGVAGFATKVHSEFYENLEKYPAIQEMFSKHIDKLNEIRDTQAQTVSTLAPGLRAEPENFIKEVRGQKRALATEIDQFVHHSLGIESQGINKYLKGSVQRFQTLSDNTRIPVTFSAVTAAFVGTAATLMFFNSMQMRHKLDQISDQQRDQSR